MEKLGGPGGWGEPGPPPGRQAGQLVAGSCQGQRPRAPVATCQLSGHMALMQAEGRQTGRAACEDCLLGGTVAAHEGGLGARHGGWLVRGCGHGVGAAAGRVCAERAPGSGLSPWPVPTGLSPPSPVVFPQLLLPCPGCGWWGQLPGHQAGCPGEARVRGVCSGAHCRPGVPTWFSEMFSIQTSPKPSRGPLCVLTHRPQGSQALQPLTRRVEATGRQSQRLLRRL